MQTPRTPLFGLALAAVCAALLGATCSPALGYSSLENPPAGANDFKCKPSPAHPRPVILVHGLGSTMQEGWGYFSPRLAAKGYCVFALTYGLDARAPYFGGVIPVEKSAVELKAFVKKVRNATGARKVDLVGHSEGTFMPEYWLKYLGGASRVNRYVAMTPLYDGTTLGGLDMIRDLARPLGLSDPLVNLVASFCGSCPQFLRGSPMVKTLNAHGGPAVPGVAYTTIMSRYDELVKPYTSGYLDAPNATNFVLQEVCPTDLSEHIGPAFDPVAFQITLNALDPAHAKPVNCGLLPPVTP